MARFATRVTSIESSPTVRLGNLVAEMKACGEKGLSLSVGEADFTKQMMAKLGDVVFWKSAMRPGRPMAVP